MEIAIIIQSRDRSTRYPYKSIMNFYNGKSILKIQIDRFKVLPFQIIVATDDNSPNTVRIAEKNNVEVFIGKTDLVLDRFVDICKMYKLDGVFRVCGDNPFVQLALMYPVATWGLTGEYDYVAFENSMKRHEGLFLEYVSADALNSACFSTIQPYDHEHVTPYIYERPNKYKLKLLPIPPIMDKIQIRLTVDTKSDFNIVQKLYKIIGEKYWGQIYEYLYFRPKILKEMRKNIKENEK